MTLLTPVAGLLLAAAVIPPLLLLYFLRLRRRRQRIASTLLWPTQTEDLRANAPFQRLRPSLLLFLQLLALLLLAAAIMQPQLEGAGRGGERTILLIDRSASMNATDGDADAPAAGTTRLEAAKARARERLEAIYAGGLFGASGGETMIIAFADEAEVIKRFSRSKQDLLRAIDAIEPTDGRSRIGRALELARAFTTNVDPEAERPRETPAFLEIFSDGRIADLEEQVLRGETATWHAIGTPEVGNLSISTLSVERPWSRPTAVEVFAAIANHGPEPVTVDVQLSVDGAALSVVEVDLPARGTVARQAVEDAGEDPDAAGTAAIGGDVLVPGRGGVSFTPFEQTDGAVIEVAIVGDDALGVDDAARVVVPPPRSLRVAVVGDASGLVESALAGMGLAALERLSERDIRDAEPAELDRWDAIVVAGAEPWPDPPAAGEATPPEDAGVESDAASDAGRLLWSWPPAGRWVFMGDAPPLAGLEPYGEADVQLVLRTASEHPVMRFVEMDDVVVRTSQLVQPGGGVEVLVRGSESPLVLETVRGPLHVILATFDPLDSTWPFDRSFVAFLVNAVEHLGRRGEGPATRPLAPGEAIRARLPAGATDIEVVDPEGRTRAVLTPDPRLTSWGPIRRAGLHELRWTDPVTGDREERLYAVNADASESMIVPPASIDLPGGTVVVDADGATGMHRLWPWAIAVCLVVLTLEWWMWTRRMA